MSDDDAQCFVVGRRGRPPRAETRATERIEFVVTAAERQALQKMAAENGYRSLAAAVRDACNAFIEDYGGRVVFVGSGDRFGKRPPS